MDQHGHRCLEGGSAFGGVGRGEREDGDGGRDFWVKTRFEVS
jgi:hypothetical protein